MNCNKKKHTIFVQLFIIREMGWDENDEGKVKVALDRTVISSFIV